MIGSPHSGLGSSHFFHFTLVAAMALVVGLALCLAVACDGYKWSPDQTRGMNGSSFGGLCTVSETGPTYYVDVITYYGYWYYDEVEVDAGNASLAWVRFLTGFVYVCCTHVSTMREIMLPRRMQTRVRKQRIVCIHISFNFVHQCLENITRLLESS